MSWDPSCDNIICVSRLMYLRSIAFPPASELVDFKRVVAAYNVLTLDNYCSYSIY